MHELGLTQSIVDICAEHAAGARVIRVTLEIGVLAAVMPDAIRFCFDVCTQGTALEGAVLQVLAIPGRGRCRGCRSELAMDDFLARCSCGSVDIECIAGAGLRIKNMEVI